MQGRLQQLFHNQVLKNLCKLNSNKELKELEGTIIHKEFKIIGSQVKIPKMSQKLRKRNNP